MCQGFSHRSSLLGHFSLATSSTRVNQILYSLHVVQSPVESNPPGGMFVIHIQGNAELTPAARWVRVVCQDCTMIYIHEVARQVPGISRDLE